MKNSSSHTMIDDSHEISSLFWINPITTPDRARRALSRRRPRTPPAVPSEAGSSGEKEVYREEWEIVDCDARPLRGPEPRRSGRPVRPDKRAHGRQQGGRSTETKNRLPIG